MKVKDYLMLMKPSLSIMVVFSSIIAYLLSPQVVEYNWLMILELFISGGLITGSANAINQVVERDTDAKMKRTAHRPVAAGRMTPGEGWLFAIVTGIIGVVLLGYWFNWMAASLGAFSLFLYAFIYTPLKKINSIAVLMGAVPGALPCLIGWVAGDDRFSLGGWVLFAFQFFWQFPHFWAIAWVAHEDYSSVGFKLLPSEQGPTRFTALQTVLYSLLLVPVTLLPFFTGMSTYQDAAGRISVAVVIFANLFMIARSVRLYQTMEVKAARAVMFGSYLYLPLILLALLLSKTVQT
ncbi:MAG: protoheme IX farnesyltransferase [Bacteroidetes bacterium]|nr:protoheme IX farnesyltransferase [Bacteroidota bacterium]